MERKIYPEITAFVNNDGLDVYRNRIELITFDNKLYTTVLQSLSTLIEKNNVVFINNLFYKAGSPKAFKASLQFYGFDGSSVMEAEKIISNYMIKKQKTLISHETLMVSRTIFIDSLMEACGYFE